MVYMDSMATSNFVAPSVPLSKAKKVNGPKVNIADGSHIMVQSSILPKHQWYCRGVVA